MGVPEEKEEDSWIVFVMFIFVLCIIYIHFILVPCTLGPLFNTQNTDSYIQSIRYGYAKQNRADEIRNIRTVVLYKNRTVD